MGKFRQNKKLKIEDVKLNALVLICILALFLSWNLAEAQDYSEMKELLTSTSRPWPSHEYLIDAISNSTKRDEKLSHEDVSLAQSESGNPKRYRLIKTEENIGSNRQWTFPIIAERPDLRLQNTNRKPTKSIQGKSLVPLIVVPARRYSNNFTVYQPGTIKTSNQPMNIIQKQVMTSSIPFTLKTEAYKINNKSFFNSSKPQDFFNSKPIQLVFESNKNDNHVKKIDSIRSTPKDKSTLELTGKSELVPMTDLKFDPIISASSKLSHNPTTIFYRPVINHYMNHANTNSTKELPPLVSTSNPTLAEDNQVKTNSNTSEIRFKIWSFVDGDLNLLSEKKVPTWVVAGANFSDGEIMNLETIPNPLRSMVHSAMNYSGTVSKRHSGPGNDFHWQKLPVLVSESSSWSAPTPPQTLNYVLWNNKEKPQSNSPLQGTYSQLIANSPNYPVQQVFHSIASTPLPYKIKDDGLESWLKVQCELLNRMKNKTPSLQSQYEELANREKEIWNMILLELANSKKIYTNQNLGHYEYTKNDDIPSPTANPGQKEFWASLYPIYQNLIKNGNTYLTPTTPVPYVNHKKQTPSEYSESTSIDEYSYYPSNEADYNSDAAPVLKSSLKKKPKKSWKKKIKKAKKIAKKFKKKKGKFSLLDPDKFHFNYAFGIDILSLFKKLFFTILALKAAPLIILTFLAVTPLLLLFWPKVLKLIALGHSIYSLKKHTQPSYGWNHGQDVHHHYHKQDHYGHGYPVEELGTWVQSSYGDPIHPRDYSNIKEQTAPVEYYDPELDTQHNRKVMEILINSKNATLKKLLENWSLERNYASNKTRRD